MSKVKERSDLTCDSLMKFIKNIFYKLNLIYII
nr:MAG TPA: hypothetical protein [Caudoviricetes sp.]